MGANMIKRIVKDVFPWSPDVYHRMISTGKALVNIVDKPVIILLYHRVANLETDPQLLAVSTENFAAQMKYIKENFDILRFEDNWENIKRPSIVVTFDDGYVDNLVNAKPILEKYEVPATIFVATGNIGTGREFWCNDLERLILLNENLPKSLELPTKNTEIIDFSSENKKYEGYYELHRLCLEMQAGERNKFLEKLESILTPNIPLRNLFRTLNEKELQDLDASKYITIGAHTVTHTKLAIQPCDVQRWEIMESKRVLEAILGHEITTFSYPFGCYEDYTKETVKIVKQAGYTKAASNFPGQIHAKKTSAFEIPRQIVRDWDVDRFKAELNTFWTN